MATEKSSNQRTSGKVSRNKGGQRNLSDNNNNNTEDDVYGAVIMAQPLATTRVHTGSFDECRTAPDGR